MVQRRSYKTLNFQNRKFSQKTPQISISHSVSNYLKSSIFYNVREKRNIKKIKNKVRSNMMI